LGVTFTLTVFLIQRSMLAEMFRSAPPGMPNVFLINITERERAGLLELLRRQPGVESPPEIVAAVPARLQAVNGTPIEKLGDGPVRRYRRSRSVTWAAAKPEHTTVLSGAWWQGPQKQPLVSLAEDAARDLRAAPGAELRFESSGRVVTARVASVHRTESVRPGATIEFVFSPGSLEGLPAIYFGGMRVRAAAVPALQRAAYRLYPTVTIVNAADVLEIIQEVVDQIALVVRFVSFFAVAAGAIVLASSIAGTRLRRMREVAIFKALGATRGRVARIFSIELLVLGSMAGLAGSVLGSVFASLLLSRFFDAGFRFDPLPNVFAIAVTALLAVAAGWAAGYRFLAQRPLEALRHE
jgi:putative ABC transport system permease protein